MPARRNSSLPATPGTDEASRSAPRARILVSVLTPVLNEEAELEASVRSMQQQRLEGEVEFLFIDGGSTDGTRAILDRLAADDPRIRILGNPERRTPQALNIGLRAARGEFVARMDAHARYPPGYLQAAVRRLRDGDVDWVCGPQVPEGEGAWSSRVALALGSPLGTGGSQRWEPGEGVAPEEAGEELVSEDSGVFTGVWRRSTLDDLGGWDEGWPINQDCELLARVHRAGGRVVLVPEMAARYVPRDSLPRLARQYLAYGRYRAKTSRRHPNTLRPSHLVVPLVPLALGAAALGGRRLRRLGAAGVGGYAAAVLAATVAVARPGDRADLLRLPAVFATMHLMWGAGYLYGALRYGPPLAGIRTKLLRRSSPGPGR